MTRILFPTDFSETSQNGLSFALALIANSGWRIDLLHVYDSSVVQLNQGSNRNDQRIEQKLMQMYTQIPLAHRGTYASRDNKYPSESILSFAKEIGSDLIFMGLRQKFSMTDRLIGTVTGRTMENSSIPVVAIPNGAQYTGIKQLLVISNDYEEPLDGKLAEKVQHVISSLGEDPTIRLIRLNLQDAKNEVYQEIHHALTDQNFDLICVPSSEKDLLVNLYSSSTPRKILFQKRIPILLL